MDAADAGRPEGDARAETERFARQLRLPDWGAEGQARLQASRVALVGVGALGGGVAQWLVRAGVGELRLIDRDTVALSNLPRQVLFDEDDARQGRAKVSAAARHLERIGGPTRLHEHPAHLDARLLRRLGREIDLWIDGTDNPATRYLLNDYAVKFERPWIYAGAVGTSGVVLPVMPEVDGPCLRCLFPEPPPAGLLPTCDSAGVLGPAVGMVSAAQATWALRYLTLPPERRAAELRARWWQLDPWSFEARTSQLARDPDCPTCARRDFEFLETAEVQLPEVLCGRDAVQLPSAHGSVDVEGLRERLIGSGARAVERREQLLCFEAEGLRFSVFPDGRALVEGTEDPALARQVGDRWLT
ncbi:MAG: ThiF family adenylyltransferase [Planctomycetota bacterium]|jgi:adenylyltransferase/sulfurtransferase